MSKGKRASWAERAAEALTRSGYRRGGARALIVDLLSQQDCCLSAQEIAEELRSEGRRVGTASVYRALDVLHELGLVQRVDVGGDAYRYEPVEPDGDHHHHAVCESCGRVTAFEDPTLERAIQTLGRRLSHTVAAHDVVLRGACSRCESTS